MTIRTAITLTLVLLLGACSAPPPPAPAATDHASAVEAYRTWVLGQADQFMGAVEEFVAAVEAGDRTKARALYAPSRAFFERIEPIAEALGDFDPRIDAREGDVPEAEWKGYHRIEKILWSDQDPKAAVPVAQALRDDVRLLRARLETATITASAMAAGAVELLNEVSTSKVTGEEERYSHTDLWDFEANIQGAQQVWQVLSGPVRTTDAELAKTLDDRFAVLYGLLEGQKKGGVFRSYTEVDPKEVPALAAAVDALAEPLAQLGRHYPAE